jgi:hypothetical protein
MWFLVFVDVIVLAAFLGYDMGKAEANIEDLQARVAELEKQYGVKGGE